MNTTADGSLYFTVEDIAKWDEALEKRKLISRASYEQMWTPVRLNNGTTAPYGFGWRIAKTDSGHRVVEHGGAWQGFASYIVRYPDDRLTVAVLCNRAGASASYIAKHIAGFYVPSVAPRVRHGSQTRSCNPEFVRGRISSRGSLHYQSERGR